MSLLDSKQHAPRTAESPLAAPKAARRPPTTQLERALDLRKRPGREVADYLLSVCHHLLPEDRALIRAVYDRGLRVSEVAALRGESPKTLRARLRRLIQRCFTDEFRFVATRRRHWRGLRKQVACACILEGRTYRDAARRLGVSVHVVRRHIDAIELLAREPK